MSKYAYYTTFVFFSPLSRSHFLTKVKEAKEELLFLPGCLDVCGRRLRDFVPKNPTKGFATGPHI